MKRTVTKKVNNVDLSDVTRHQYFKHQMKIENKEAVTRQIRAYAFLIISIAFTLSILSKQLIAFFSS